MAVLDIFKNLVLSLQTLQLAKCIGESHHLESGYAKKEVKPIGMAVTNEAGKML